MTVAVKVTSFDSLVTSAFVVNSTRSARNHYLHIERTHSKKIMSHNVKVCDIGEDVKEALKKFRFRKHDVNSALIMKVDREKQLICIDEQIDDISIDELRENLPGHQPRFVVYSYRMAHSDGRVSYPMCFIFITPQDSQIELQIMYAGTKLALQRETDLTRVYEVRELDELTEEWLKEKLQK